MGSITSPRELRTLAQCPNIAISAAEDDAEIRKKYRPFLLDPEIESTDWISKLELDTVIDIAEKDLEKTGSRLKVLVLYGSLRKRYLPHLSLSVILQSNPPHSSYSKLMAFEASRILHRLGCDVRIFNPSLLPIRDSVPDTHASVQELRSLSLWSDGHVWVSPEQHGNLTAVFKNQIDWIPLATGSVRPTQGRTLSIIQVNGGSQSFNALNSLRVLGRWMRMWTIPNQSSLPMAWKMFEDEGGNGDGRARLLEGGNRERLVDCMEEFVKFTVLQRPWRESFGDRFSERKERRMKEEKRALEAAAKEKEKDVVDKI
jgi:arsenic resistance protein ArsH